TMAGIVMTLLISIEKCTQQSFVVFFFSSRRRHTRSVSAFLLNRSSDLDGWFIVSQRESVKNDKPTISMSLSHCIHQTLNSKASRSEERRVGKECRYGC